LIPHYRAYFGDEYANLRHAIEQMHVLVGQSHSDAAIAEFKARFRTAAERRQFWLQFAQIPEPGVDLDAVVGQWRTAREAVLRALDRKGADPLEPHEVDEVTATAITAHAANVDTVAQLGARYHEVNREIEAIKQRAAAANVGQLRDRVALLRAVRTRHEPNIAALCTALQDAKAAKVLTEQARDSARAALERHRREVFPQYQRAINQYLERFGAGFRLAEVQAVDNRGGASCTYNVIINNQPIPVGGAQAPGQPYFGSALSAGDRNALALAFFFASLETDPGLAHRIVVIDDPISSLDNHRTVTTIHAIRALADRVAQVILLSHSKPFLLGVWDVTERINRAALEVARDVGGSTLRAWNVTADSETENDRRHAMLREYDARGAGDPRVVAMALRPTLEAFMRVAFPEYFPAGSLLGPFVDRCRRQISAGQPILAESLTNELWELLSYANRFHHDSNLNAHNEVINDQELVGFVRRALAFARR
jgi:wobble nucleotide-excising tRNase